MMLAAEGFDILSAIRKVGAGPGNVDLEIEGAGSRSAPGYNDLVELDVVREVIQN